MEWCSRRTKHKNISKVFEVWMFANAYKGLRTYDIGSGRDSTSTRRQQQSIYRSYMKLTADITYTIEINEKTKQKKEKSRPWAATAAAAAIVCIHLATLLTLIPILLFEMHTPKQASKQASNPLPLSPFWGWRRRRRRRFFDSVSAPPTSFAYIVHMRLYAVVFEKFSV